MDPATETENVGDSDDEMIPIDPDPEGNYGAGSEKQTDPHSHVRFSGSKSKGIIQEDLISTLDPESPEPTHKDPTNLKPTRRRSSSAAPGGSSHRYNPDGDHVNPDSAIESLWLQLSELPPVPPIQLTFFRKLSISSGHILNDLCASLWFSYLLLYFQKVVEFDHTSSSFDSRYAAGLMFLGQIVDGIATPLIGYEADREVNCWLCKVGYGRCKSWHLVGSICVALSFPFIFSPCIGCKEFSSDWAKLIYYGPFIAIFQIGWASCQISHLALIPKMHPDELVRTELLAMRYAFTVGSNVVVFLMTWFTLGNSDSCQITPQDEINFMRIAFVAVGIGTVFTILFHCTVKEEPDDKVKKTVHILNSRTDLMRRLSSHSINLDSHNSSRPSGSGSDSKKPKQSTSARKSKSMVEIKDNQVNANTMEDDSEVDCSRPLLHQDLPISEIDNRLQRSVSFESEILIADNNKVRLSKLSTRNLNIGKETMTMRDWLTLPQFYIVALVYMATRQSVNLTQVYIPLYLQDSLLLQCRTIATIPLTMYLSGFITSLFIKVLNKHLGRQLAYLLGSIFCVVGSGLILTLNWEEHWMKEYFIYVVAILLGGGASAILVTSLSITADMIGNNVENGAFVYGAMSFCDKVSCGLTILLISTLVPCGDENNKSSLEDDDPCKPIRNGNVEFYRHVLGVAAGGCALIGVFGIILLTLQIHYQSAAQKRRVVEQKAG